MDIFHFLVNFKIYLFVLALNEFLVLKQTTGISTTRNVEQSSSSVMGLQIQVSWTENQTKIFLDLYKKFKPKLGTLHIKNVKKLWEILSQEINKLLNSNFTPNNCENRWRVLERAYKKYIDNQNKTGQGKKYFAYLEEMDKIFRGRKNVEPVVLLSSETIEEMSETEADQDRSSKPSTSSSDIRKNTNQTPKTEKSTVEGSLKRKRTPIVNRNLTLAGMKKDKREYQDARLEIERAKLEIQKKN